MNPTTTSSVVAAYPLLPVERVRILLAVNLHTERTEFSLIEVDLASIAEGDMFRVLLAPIVPYMPPTGRSIPRRGPLAMRI